MYSLQAVTEGLNLSKCPIWKIFPLVSDILISSSAWLIFSAIGLPNPYWIDIYPTKFKLHLKNEKKKDITIYPLNSSQKISNRAFIFIDKELAKQIDYIDFFQRYQYKFWKFSNIKNNEFKTINKFNSTLHTINAYQLLKRNDEANNSLFHFQEKSSGNH